MGVTTMLTETLAYTGDGLIAAHTLDRAALLDERQYAYAAQSRRLVSERLDLDGSTAWTNTFTFDAGAAQGAGVLTRINQPGGADWSAHMDDHLRVDRETNNVVRRLAYGRVNMQPNFGFATIGIKLNDRPVPFLSLGNSDTNWPTRWQAQIELTPGTHTLTASAVHPSQLYTNSTSVTFTNVAVDQTTLSYYSEGQLTGRVWKNGAGETNRIQTFQWDAKGRLYRFTERDVNGDGHDWSAVYDSLDRRWQTVTVPTIGNTALTSQLKTFTQAYDPHGEFLEVGVYVDGRWSWKVHGPDMNGAYGGMNGLGGWDAVVTGPDTFHPLLSDVRGNILGAYNPENSNTEWNDARVTGYGSVAGRRPLSLGEGINLWEAGSWRGRYPELSGLYNLGARYYDPVAGRFLSPDPLGHDSDPSLYAAFNGDPVNFFDPDGRLGVSASVASNALLGLTPDGDATFRSITLAQYTKLGYTLGEAHAMMEASSAYWADFLSYSRQGRIHWGNTASSTPTENGGFGQFVAGAFADTQMLQQSIHELNRPDFSTLEGRATFVVAGVALVAGTADFVGNVITLGGKGLVKQGAKTAVKEIAEIGSKDVFMAARTTGTAVPIPLHDIKAPWYQYITPKYTGTYHVDTAGRNFWQIQADNLHETQHIMDFMNHPQVTFLAGKKFYPGAGLARYWMEYRGYRAGGQLDNLASPLQSFRPRHKANLISDAALFGGGTAAAIYLNSDN